LIGVQGIVRMAVSGFDAACWDALAIAKRVTARKNCSAPSRVRSLAYNSCGLGLMDDRGALADEAQKLLSGRFHAIKLRLGYPRLAEILPLFKPCANALVMA
jgi:mandelate racemase